MSETQLVRCPTIARVNNFRGHKDWVDGKPFSLNLWSQDTFEIIDTFWSENQWKCTWNSKVFASPNKFVIRWTRNGTKFKITKELSDICMGKILKKFNNQIIFLCCILIFITRWFVYWQEFTKFTSRADQYYSPYKRYNWNLISKTTNIGS